MYKNINKVWQHGGFDYKIGFSNLPSCHGILSRNPAFLLANGKDNIYPENIAGKQVRATMGNHGLSLPAFALSCNEFAPEHEGPLLP